MLCHRYRYKFDSDLLKKELQYDLKTPPYVSSMEEVTFQLPKDVNELKIALTKKSDRCLSLLKPLNFAVLKIPLILMLSKQFWEFTSSNLNLPIRHVIIQLLCCCQQLTLSGLQWCINMLAASHDI